MPVSTCSCSVLPPVEHSAENVPGSAAGDAPFAWPKPPPVLRQTISATEKTRQALSLGSSLLAHVVVIAAIGVAPAGSSTVRWVPVRAGPATVELQASLGQVAEELAEGEPVALVEKLEFAEAMEPVAQKSLEAAAAASLDRPAVETSVPEVVLTSLAALEMAVPAAPARLDRPESKETVVAVSEPPVPRVRLPRTNVGRQHMAELIAETIPTPTSAASTASDGAESSVPSPVYNPAPRYPPEALAARITGRVILRVEVAADGCVLKASVYRSSGVASLDASALAAVRGWRFTPAARADARPREVAVPINFVLEG